MKSSQLIANSPISLPSVEMSNVSDTVNAGGSYPWGVAVNPTGSKVYVTNRYSVADNDSNNVSVINTATNSVVGTVNVGLSTVNIAITPDGTKIYVADWQSNNISVIDAATNTVTATVPVGKQPMGIAVTPDGTKVYVANAESDNVSVIDTATNTVTATVNSGKYYINYPNKVAIGSIFDSDMTDQSIRATSNETEDLEVEETNLSSSDEKNVVELNNSKNNNSGSDKDNSSSEDESNKNNSIPGVGLLGSLIYLYGGWRLRKK